jgi:hypothetical protein
MGNDQTLADCTDFSVFAEADLLAFFEDDEMESVMERASVGLLEAAEAMAQCNFRMRKALNMIESQKNAELVSEKKAAEQACNDLQNLAAVGRSGKRAGAAGPGPP